MNKRIIAFLNSSKDLFNAFTETGEALKNMILVYIEILMYIIMVFLAVTGQVILLPGCWTVLSQIKSANPPSS